LDIKRPLCSDPASLRGLTGPSSDLAKGLHCKAFNKPCSSHANFLGHRAVTGVLSHLSSSLEIKVCGMIYCLLLFTDMTAIQAAVLAKSIVRAGQLGSAALPSAVGATQAGPENARFTLIGNAGALALANQFES
jgi:hypothetical protein